MRLPHLLPLLVLAALAGCSQDPSSTTCLHDCTPPPPPPIHPYVHWDRPVRVDLLLSIDNSRSMADKQRILALAVPDLVRGLVDPPCADAMGIPAPQQPQGGGPCPTGTERKFEPLTDVHIGVISTSIGGHGADSCPAVVPDGCGNGPNTTNDDKGHLLTRTDPCSGASVVTYQDRGFLAWDPRQVLTPPGEDEVEGMKGEGLAPTLKDMVLGAGEIGCGYESQLESIYRFLIDPAPPASMEVIDNKATPVGVDSELLAQRAAFLRPDSLLAIVMLTDEDDCSIKEYGQAYYVAQIKDGGTDVRMPRARQECAINPNDPCCKSCGQSAGACPADPSCTDAQGNVALLSAEEDDLNLRCWDQKRRFGIDLLYPIDRYVTGFTSFVIQDRSGAPVPNPLFSDLDPSDDIRDIRSPSQVILAGLVGVPWQDIARDPPDLKKGFMNAAELAVIRPGDDHVDTWGVILGEPATHVPPLDPHMVAAVEKRTGKNPITGDPLVDASQPGGDPISGHERTIAKNDLQYACIFPLLPGTERDCTDASLPACDCADPANDNPLCDQDPQSGAPTVQARGKAYPALRQLSVLRELGPQGVVASVCPAQVTDENASDFGYRPAVDALLERIDDALGESCLPRTLTPDAEGRVPCTVVEARNTGGNICKCDMEEARWPMPPEHAALKKAVLESTEAQQNGWNCACEVPQLQGAELAACQNDASPMPVVDGVPASGFCYVDPATTPPTGNADIVARCPDDEKRLVRFVGRGEIVFGAGWFMQCSAGE